MGMLGNESLNIWKRKNHSTASKVIVLERESLRNRQKNR